MSELPERRGLELVFGELEAAVGAAERALMLTDWKALDSAMAAQRRLTHELEILFDARPQLRAGQEGERYLARLERIFSFRANQVARLRFYSESLQKKLEESLRWRRVLRAQNGEPAHHGAGLDLLR